MTSESLSRSLQLLAGHGIVVRGHRVVLNDRAQVERFCKPDPLIDSGESDVVHAW
jgi:CRP/FNR family transcriptional activator FtrB